MSWYAVCDKCGVMSGGGGEAGGGLEPNLPEGWLQLRTGRLYCTKPDCEKAGKSAFRKQKPRAVTAA